MSNVAKLKKQAAEFELKKQFDKALGVYVKLLDSFDEYADELDVALFNRVGDLMLRQGNVADAVDYYDRAVDRYADTGFFNNAIALCNKILRHSPGRAIVYYKLGKISAQKGFKNDAKVNFLEYADRMQKSGHVDEAFRALKEFADLCPDQDEIRLMLADQLTKADRKSEAIEQLQTLHERYDGEGRTREAEATADRIRAIDPTVEPRSSGGGRRTSTSDDLIFLDLNEPSPRGKASTPTSFAPQAAPPRRATPPASFRATPARSTPSRSTPAISGDAMSLSPSTPLDGIIRTSNDGLTFEQTPSQSLLGIQSSRFSDDDTPPISQSGAGSTPEHSVEPLLDLEPTSLAPHPTPSVGRPIATPTPSAGSTPSEPQPAQGSRRGTTDEVSAHDESGLGIPRSRPTPIDEAPTIDFDLSALTSPVAPAPPIRPTPHTPHTSRAALDGLPLMDLEAPPPDRTQAPRLLTPLGSPRLPSDLELVDLPGAPGESSREEAPSAIGAGDVPGAGRDAGDVESIDSLDGGDESPVIEFLQFDDDDASVDEAEPLPVSRAVVESVTDAPTDTSARIDDVAAVEETHIDEAIGVTGEAANDRTELTPPGPTDVVESAESAGDDQVWDEAAFEAELRNEIEDEEGRVSTPPAGTASAGVASASDAPAEPDSDTDTFEVPTPSASRRSTMVAVRSAELLRASVDADPENWPLRRELAEALLEAGDRDGGIRELETAMSGADRGGKLELASALAEEIARIEPDVIKHHQKRVEYAFRTNDRSRLIEAYLSLADALLRADQSDKARTVYQRVFDLAPDEIRARAALDTITAPEPAPPPPTPAQRPSTQQRASTIVPAVPTAPAAPPSNESFVNLGDWLRDTEGPKDTRMVVAEQEPSGDEEADFADMLRKFKQGIAENVAAEDYQSHYDLAIAFKEMGLLDEAISEFQKALGGANKVPTYEALGQCFIDKEQFKLASSILSRALNEKASEDQLVGVLYLLGRAAEAQGKAEDALNFYQRVFVQDIQFRDVADRIDDVERAAR